MNKNKENPNWKGGITQKEYFCIDCQKKIHFSTALYRSGRCHSCGLKQYHADHPDCYKGKNAPGYKHGKCCGEKYCIDCDMKINNRATRCRVCNAKNIAKNRQKLTGKNNPNYKTGQCLKQYYCKDCGKKISLLNGLYGTELCHSCSTKIRLANPENHPSYVDGRSFLPYTKEFNESLKEAIRQRDNHICQKCGIAEVDYKVLRGRVLDVHHIDYNKQNCKEENLISLCNTCNIKVNYNRENWIKLFQNLIQKNLLCN
jgi:DNA-directed RNA polymerase subunit RPC12/RpoP